MKKFTHIKLNPDEIESGVSRVKLAEGLINQLPSTHEGRNTWLLHHGIGIEAESLRAGYPEKRFCANIEGKVNILDCRKYMIKTLIGSLLVIISVTLIGYMFLHI